MKIKRHKKSYFEELFSTLYNNELKFRPIGNHNLKRHLVYKYSVNGETYAFKYYYLPDKKVKEVKAITRLFGKVNVPEVIFHGNIDEKEYMVTKFVDGNLLDDLLYTFEEITKVELFISLGKTLRSIHDSIRVTDDSNYPLKFINDRDFIYDRILSTDTCPDMRLLEYAVEYIKKSIKKIKHKQELAFVHGDFDGRNIMLGKNNEISCIFDFENSSIDSPYIDFASLYIKYFMDNPELMAAFEKGYNGAIDDYTLLQILSVDYLIKIMYWCYPLNSVLYDEMKNKLELIIKDSD